MVFVADWKNVNTKKYQYSEVNYDFLFTTEYGGKGGGGGARGVMSEIILAENAIKHEKGEPF
jgi:hypothetical protein